MALNVSAIRSSFWSVCAFSERIKSRISSNRLFVAVKETEMRALLNSDPAAMAKRVIAIENGSALSHIESRC